MTYYLPLSLTEEQVRLIRTLVRFRWDEVDCLDANLSGDKERELKVCRDILGKITILEKHLEDKKFEDIKARDVK